MRNRTVTAGLIAALGLTTMLVHPALAQSVVVTDAAGGGPSGSKVMLGGGETATLMVPSVEVVGGSIDEATIRSIFTEGPPANAEALATLDAASMTIPELRFVGVPKDEGTGTSTVVISNVVMTDVTDGVAGTLAVGGIAVDGGADSQVEVGAIELKDVNLRTVLQLNNALAGASSEPQPVFSSFSVAGINATGDDGSCTIGDVNAAEFATRPLTTMPLAEGFALAGKVDEAETPAPADVAKLLHFYADIATAYRLGGWSVSGISCDVTDDEGKPMAIRMGAAQAGALTPGQIPELSVDGFSLRQGEQDWIEIGRMVFKAADISGPLNAIQAAGESIDQAWIEANQRQLIGAFQGFALSAMGMDLPDMETPGARIAATMENFDVSLDAYENGIPTKVSVTLDGLHIKLPENDPESQPLIALGYGELDIDLAIEAAWDRENSTIQIDSLALEAGNAGRIAIAATIGNATPQLFDLNPEVATAAAMGLTVKEVKVDFDDAGLMPKVIAIAAAEQKVEETAFRQAMAGMAQGMIIVGLGGTPAAQQVSQAVTAFISGAPHLSVTATAIDPMGLGQADFAAAQADPTVLLRRLNLTAQSGESTAPAPAAASPNEPAAERQGTDRPAANN